MGAGKRLYKFTLYCQHMSAESCCIALIVLQVCGLMVLPVDPPKLEEKVLLVLLPDCDYMHKRLYFFPGTLF